MNNYIILIKKKEKKKKTYRQNGNRCFHIKIEFSIFVYKNGVCL